MFKLTPMALSASRRNGKTLFIFYYWRLPSATRWLWSFSDDSGIRSLSVHFLGFRFELFL